MKHRQDNNAIFLSTKIHAVRKTIGDDTPNIFANNGKLKRVRRCERHATINFSHELKRKADSLAFVSCTCFDELCTRGTVKRDW